MGVSEFARHIGVKRKTLDNIERGLQRPTVEVIEGICRTHPEFAYWFVTGLTKDNDLKPIQNNPDFSNYC